MRYCSEECNASGCARHNWTCGALEVETIDEHDPDGHYQLALKAIVLIIESFTCGSQFESVEHAAKEFIGKFHRFSDIS